jgi:uncharacterized protein YukE
MSYLDVDTEAVAGSGSATSATSAEWQALGADVKSTLTEASTAVRDAAVGGALENFGADWNPKVEQIAQQVDTVGNNAVSASHTVHNADADSSTVLTAQGHETEATGTALRRPITA